MVSLANAQAFYAEPHDGDQREIDPRRGPGQRAGRDEKEEARDEEPLYHLRFFLKLTLV
jgi:hypothetical protein